MSVFVDALRPPPRESLVKVTASAVLPPSTLTPTYDSVLTGKAPREEHHLATAAAAAAGSAAAPSEKDRLSPVKLHSLPQSHLASNS